MSSRPRAHRFGARIFNRGRLSFLLAACVSLTLAMSGTASASLLGGLTSTITNLTAPATSPVTVPTGLNQLTTGLQGLLTGVQTSATTGQAAISGFQATVNPAAASAIAALQTSLQDAAAHAAALDTAGLQSDTTAAIAALQGAATAEVGALTGVALTQALTNGLTIAQQVVSPVCSILGSPAALASGVGLDLTRLYPLSTAIQPVDLATSNLLGNIYSSLYDQILGSVVAQVPTVGPVASAILTLLKYNWTSTYYPPNGGAPIVKTTKALLDVPTPIDVDNSGSFDLCGTTTLSIGTGGIKVVQQITKLPLAPAIMPVDISGALLGVIGFGYETHDSSAPINFTSAVSVPGTNGNLIDVDNAYTVFRGQTLTLPPLLNNFVPFALPFGLGTATLPNIPALLQPAPKPKITDVISIGSSALALRFRHEDEPSITHDGVSLTGALKYDYTGSAPSDLASFSTGVSGISFGIGTHPAGTAFNMCVASLIFTSGACDPPENTHSGSDKTSLSFTSSQPTKADVSQTAIAPPAGAECPTLPVMDAHITGTRFSTGLTPIGTAAGSGKYWIDTGGGTASGCLAIDGALLPALGTGVLATLPDGFSATHRDVSLHATQFLGFTTGTAPDTKAGSIFCPAGTSFTTPTELIVTSVSFTSSVCSFPPANAGGSALPTITSPNTPPVIDGTLTAHAGTWTPGSPNTPSFLYQFNKCDAAGANCVPIGSPSTTTTHFLDYGNGISGDPGSDLGHTFTVTVTATNLDGTATATSAPTGVTVLPPPPANSALPVISSVGPPAGPGPPAGVGRQLVTTNGSWSSALSFTYEWLQCDSSGGACVAIPSTNSINYTPTADDMGHVIKVRVTAHNHNPTATSATSASGPFIPPVPTNSDPPAIFNGASNATGQTVLTGDSLVAHTGTWQYQTSFSYEWQQCDSAGNGCSPIGGANLSSYSVQSGDIGHALRVKVTGTNIDGSFSVVSAATGAAVLNDLQIKPPTQVVDGTVNAVAASGTGTEYLGGSFDTAGTATGGAGQIAASLTSAGSVTGAAKTQGGPVRAVAADGSNGYFLGGSFTSVQGQPCNALAHITAAGLLDSTFCQPGLVGSVRAVDVANGLVAVGGSFTLGGHGNLAFFDTTTAAAIFADQDAAGPINSITDDAGAKNFYIGGDFTQVGGTTAMGLAKFTIGAGNVITRAAWNAGVDKCAEAIGTVCTTHTASVKTVRWIGIGSNLLPGVFVGGSFDRTIIGGTYTARNNAAAMGTPTAATLGGWNPNLNGTVNVIAAPVLVPGGFGNFPVYIGGDFTQAGAVLVPHIVQFASTQLGGGGSSGTANTSAPTTNWKPAFDNGTVTSITFDGTSATSNVYVGGSFTSVGGVVRHRLAAFKPAGTAGGVTAAEAWDPNAGRTVMALAKTGSTIVAGGSFNVLGGVTRNNLAELGPASGVTTWNPGTNGPVNALATAGGGVIVGGSFTNAGGAARSNIAAVDTGLGAANPAWNPGAGGPVNALAVSGSTVYAGGLFGTAGGQPRANLAAIDIASGAATTWNPGTTGTDPTVYAVAVDGGTVYAGGSFSGAGGQPRSSIAAIDGLGNAIPTFNPGTDGSVRTIAVNSGTIYFGGSFANAASNVRHNAAAVDTSGVATGWDPQADDVVRALLPFGATVFAAGDFLHIGGAARSHAGQVANDDGSAKSFTPEPDGAGRALGMTSGGSLVIAGDFGSIAGKLSPGAAFFGGS